MEKRKLRFESRRPKSDSSQWRINWEYNFTIDHIIINAPITQLMWACVPWPVSCYTRRFAKFNVTFFKADKSRTHCFIRGFCIVKSCRLDTMNSDAVTTPCTCSIRYKNTFLKIIPKRFPMQGFQGVKNENTAMRGWQSKNYASAWVIVKQKYLESHAHFNNFEYSRSKCGMWVLNIQYNIVDNHPKNKQ